MNLPIRVRLTLWYALLLLSTLSALSAFLLLQLRTDLERELDQELRGAVAELARTLADDPDDPGESPEHGQASDWRDDFEEAAAAILPPSLAGAQLLDPSGHVVMSYGTVADRSFLGSRGVRESLRSGGPSVFTDQLPGRQGNYRVRLDTVVLDGERRLVLLAHSLQPIEDAIANLRRVLLVACPAALLVTGVAAFWLASRALRPVRRITQDAEEIGISRLHERVAVPRSRDETGRLALTLNDMLERIESGVREKHQMVADASHELRTPLAVMRSELDVSLRAGTVPDAAREVLLSVREEVDRISRTVDNLLTTAQIDEGRLELLTATIDVATLVQEVVDRLEPLAAARRVVLAVRGDRWRARADGPRLAIAVTNLVENAIAFSSEGGEVVITLWRHPDESGVTVTDDGPGIPDAEQGRLFERFYQGADSSPDHRRGSGLGLAICRDIVLAHEGRVWFESRPGGGASFSIGLPGWRTVPSSEDT